MPDLMWSIKDGQLVRRGHNGSSNPSEEDLLNTSFDSFPVSNPITIENFRQAVGMQSGGNSSHVARTSIAAVSGRGNVLRQHFNANEVGVPNGIAISVPLSQAVDEATITYDIRFVGTNFDWGWGGKLPGLAGILPGQGGPPSGGTPSPYGWNCRGMWITPGSYPGSSNVPNEWVGYMYDPTQSSGSYGQNRQTNRSFQADTWHTVTQYYKMNTVAVEGSQGNPDGIHRMYLDGDLVYENTAQVYRLYQNANITHMTWSMFYGGDTLDWAPSIATDIDIDNLVITTPS